MKTAKAIVTKAVDGVLRYTADFADGKAGFSATLGQKEKLIDTALKELQVLVESEVIGPDDNLQMSAAPFPDYNDETVRRGTRNVLRNEQRTANKELFNG